ncbi:MAG: DUF2459 domain-containing protein [Pseudomonadota bacterium]
MGRVRRTRWTILAVATLGLFALFLGIAREDPVLYPAAPDRARWVAVVDHGWHAGLVVASADLRAVAVTLGRKNPAAAATLRQLAARYPTAPFLEIGWGEAAVYRSVRQIDDLSLSVAARALLWPTPSVLHVVPLAGPPAQFLRGAAQHPLALSEEGFAALARGLAQTASTDEAGRLDELGPGLYGGGVFFAASPAYSALHTCNHWIAGLLRRAGVPASWLTSAWSGGLMAELGWRTNDLAL